MFSKLAMPMALTLVAGSIFGPLSQTHFSKRVFMDKISSSALFDSQLTLLCLWSGFIFPRIRTFVEKRFQCLFSKEKTLKSGGVPSFLSPS